MFKVNDYVIYNIMGVYKITDIRTEKDLNDVETEYYIMEPAYGNNLTIKIPVNNSKVYMRKILSKDDVMSLIEEIPELDTVWIDDDKKRSQTFKEALKTGDTKKWIKLVKSIYIEEQEKTANGKKLMKTDEDIMKTAEKNLYEEFAMALDISPEQVFSYIKEHIE